MNSPTTSYRPDWGVLRVARDAGEQALRQAATAAQLPSLAPDDLLPQHDDSVLFTSAAVCRFKQELLGSPHAPRGFVQQWCFRDRNFRELQRNETPRWNSTFRQFGGISPMADLAAMLACFVGALEPLVGRFGGRLALNVSGVDEDLLHAAHACRMTLAKDRDSPTHYRHRYGHERLAGRNANFFVTDSAGDFFAEIGNVIVIERDAKPFAVEIAIGIETLAAALARAPSALWANVIHEANTPAIAGVSLPLIDVLSTVLHLHASGIRPFASNRGRIFRRYLALLSIQLQKENCEPAAMIRDGAQVICQVRGMALSVTHWSLLANYLEDRMQLSLHKSPLVPSQQHTKLASKWAHRWPAVEHAE